MYPQNLDPRTELTLPVLSAYQAREHEPASTTYGHHQSPVAAAGLILGHSKAIQDVCERIEMIANKQTTVLITGETGTGKERVARAIHALSRRSAAEMVSVNCAGVPANLLEDEFFGHVKGAFTDAHQTRIGRFEQAQGSTLFLDEIGDLPLELQPKLLRVLQERELHRVGGLETIQVDARVITATNADLWTQVREGHFREDLFYRVNVFPIHLPPLRERRTDIPEFIDHFLEAFCIREGLRAKVVPPDVEAELLSRPWPGNIRELENAVEMAVILSGDRQTLNAEDFPARNQPRTAAFGGLGRTQHTMDYKAIVEQFERDLITCVLERADGNKTVAASLLGMNRTTLVEKWKKLGGAAPAATDP